MDLVGLLAEGDRLRVFAAVVLGHASLDDIGAATGLDARALRGLSEPLTVPSRFVAERGVGVATANRARALLA